MPRVKTSRKPKIQDRPSARTLMLRRLRKSGKPAMLAGIAIAVLIVVPLVLRGVPFLLRPLHDEAATLLADAGLRIRHIDITGARTTPKAEIERAVDIQRGSPMLGFSPTQAAARIAALGAVRSATVERILPDTIKISVTERRPVAIWQQDDNHFALIGPDGAVLSDHHEAAARARGLPLLVGNGVPAHAHALLALLAHYPAIAKHVVAAERIDDLRWNLLLRDHTIVELPDQHAAQALARLLDAEHRIKLLERPVRTIDLRLADRLVVRPYPKGFITEAAASDHKS